MFPRAPVTILFFLTIGFLESFAESPFRFESTPGKLPKDVVPRHYSIYLQPDLKKFITTGKVEIQIEALKTVREIVLNALDMEISKASINAHGMISLDPRMNVEAQTVSFTLPEPLAPGKYLLSIEFTGHLREAAQGLFYVRYSATVGKKLMLCTQLEATDARRMFPCWDEPVFRASFEPTVVVPNKHLAVSNMPIEKEKPLGTELKEVHFQASPPMASYLVVLVSGELEALEDSFEGVRVRVITTEGKKEQGRYALESAKKILGYYNNYFGVKFPLPKLDEIAVPGGFQGAMENWGGITYNEARLLYDPKASSLETKQGVFHVMAHEMAHQWFGDLVTMAWWDNLWLNEGFASWMGTKATDYFNPEWQMGLNAGAAKSGVMRQDSLSSTHPILQPVLNESQASDAFDGITYIKGQSFLRMLENYLGADTFRAGLRLYMERHRLSSTTTADLWKALEKASAKPVNALSAGWTEQPGFPIVNVSSQCADGKETVRMDQERFTVQDPGAKPLQWQVPVALANVSQPNDARVELLQGKSATVTFPSCGGTLKANFNDAGYYRVAYSPPLFERLKGHIDLLSAEDRLNLLGDSWALVTAQRESAPSYLDLVMSLRGETNAVIWREIIGNLDLIDKLQRGQPGRATYRSFVVSLLHPQLQRLGWETRSGEPPTETLLRNSIVTALGDLGDPEVISAARTRFQEFLTHPDSLAANLRPSVIHITGRSSDATTYNQLHELARNAKGIEERKRYYGAMASSLDPALAEQTLAISLTDETIPQEAIWLVPEVASYGEQPELAWKFAQEHLSQLLGRAEEFERNRYVPAILSGFSDAERADELEKYVREKVSPAGATKAKETAEAIRLNAAIKRRELPEIDRWVAAQRRPGA
jgi:aminopeptidase N